ncbi:MAG: hypothetical protein FJY76_01170 [Candidatus Aenigmarchaeota archaeon]|nr:hypothetical protein [Candidatus Aenigmarchaeota archaeon]
MANIIEWAKNNRTDALLVALTAVSLLLMSLPLLVFSYPSFINNGDVALHYKLSSLVFENWRFLAFELYPKLFHIMVSLLAYAMPWLGVWGGMVTVTLAFVVFMPVAMYKLAFELFGSRRVSILSAFFSVIILVHNSAFVGVALAVPQTLAMTLAPAILYFFLRKRWISTGVLLGALMLLHGSWPMLVVFMFLYAVIMQCRKKAFLGWMGVAVFSTALAAIISLPLTAYNKMFLFHDTINATVLGTTAYVSSMISIFAVPLIIVPFFSFILYVYGGWNIFRKRGKEKIPMMVLLFLALVLATSQAFLLLPAGHIFGLVFISSRVLFLVFIPIAMLCAYGLVAASRGKSYVVVAVAFLFIAASIPYYHAWYEHKNVAMGAGEIEAASFLSGSGQRNAMVLFNPLRYNMQEHFIVMTGLQDFNLTNAALLLSGYNKSAVSFRYVLAEKNDSAMKLFTDANSWRLSEIYSNSKYSVFSVTGGFELEEPDIDSYVRGFTFFYNQNQRLRGLVVSEPVSLAVKSGDDVVCARIMERMDVVPCGYNQDFEIKGEGGYIRELFSTYSISEFAYRLLWLYGNGMINITASSMANITVSVPRSVPGFMGSHFHLMDVGLYAGISGAGGLSNVTVSSAHVAGAKYTETSLKSVSRLTRWVLANSWFTFPNAVWGAAYDAAARLSGDL